MDQNEHFEEMAKRSYNRRSDEELIEDLQDRIRKVEQRVKAKQRKDAPMLKELPKVNRCLKRFTQVAINNGRADLSNMTQAFLAGLERAAHAVPEDSTPKSRSRREEASVES